jgi:hypothetical protein
VLPKVRRHITVWATYPPELCLTLGSPGAARFVGFRWSPLGDQLVYDDGRGSGTAQSWAFLAYKRDGEIRITLAMETWMLCRVGVRLPCLPPFSEEIVRP